MPAASENPPAPPGCGTVHIVKPKRFLQRLPGKIFRGRNIPFSRILLSCYLSSYFPVRPFQFIIAYFLFFHRMLHPFFLSAFSSGNSSDILAVTVDESILFSVCLLILSFSAGKCPAGCLETKIFYAGCRPHSAAPQPLALLFAVSAPVAPVRLQTGCYTIRHRSRSFQAVLHGGPVPLFSHLSSPGLHQPP